MTIEGDRFTGVLAQVKGESLRQPLYEHWEWAELRLCDGKGPARGDQVGPNPTDRAKNGTKRGVLTEADGGPVAVVVTGANVHDSLLLADALEAVIVEPPDPVAGPGDPNPVAHPGAPGLDKAFDGAPSDAAARVYGYEPHVRQIGEEKLDPASGQKKHPARRWVVERTIVWLNRCRGILVRYEKKADDFSVAL